MKNSSYVLGFLAFFTLSTGALFKIMHWPYANILLVTAVMLLNFGYLPTFFYKLYKRENLKA